jgi:nitroreductase
VTQIDLADPATDAALLRARYGEADIPPAGPVNDVIRSLYAHRSVRAYLPTPLPAGTLETLVAAAQSAATSSNLQLWSVIAVEDTERKRRLAAIASNQAHIVQAPLFLVWLADLSRLDRLAASQGRKLEGRDYLESFMVALTDAALAAQNAVVALESLGLGAVYIGALRNDPEAAAAELGLPTHVLAAFGLCVGYPDPAAAAEIKPRLPQPAVLFREHYATAEEAAAIARYDGALGDFSRRQGMENETWSERVLSRMGVLKGMNGRHRNRERLHRLGFELK